MDIALVFSGCHRRGGVERCVYEAARHFGSKHAVTVYARVFEAEGLEMVDKRVIAPPDVPRSFRPLAFARAARAALTGARHDVVISAGVGNVPTDVLWAHSIHAAWLERRDVFAGDRLRSSPLRRYLPRHQVLLGMERRYFETRRNQMLMGVSAQVLKDVERLYGFPLDRAFVVNNGFDPAEFFPRSDPALRVGVRAELQLPDDGIVLLLVANELTRKGLPVLLDAVAELDVPDVHILLVGRTPPTAYSAHVARLGLAGQFHYGGSRADMGAVLAASDIFVLPTRYEAFCVAIIEALASGTPVITTNVPGAADLILEGRNGRLQHDPLDPSELAGILSDALADGTFRGWATNAAESVRNLTWAHQFDGALEAIADHSS